MKSEVEIGNIEASDKLKKLDTSMCDLIMYYDLLVSESYSSSQSDYLISKVERQFELVCDMQKKLIQLHQNEYELQDLFNQLE